MKKPIIRIQKSICIILCCLFFIAINSNVVLAQRSRGRGGVRRGGFQHQGGRSFTHRSAVYRAGAGTHVNRSSAYRSSYNHRPVGLGAHGAYTRAPFIYGGHRYYAYHGYFFHPYRPYFWGPSWHPIGFFLGGLAAAAIIISIHNAHYHYYDGVYYSPYNGGYRVIAAPVGAVIPVLPAGYAAVSVGGAEDYYYGGSFYAQANGGYQVIPPPPGAVVYNLPQGCTSVNMGGTTYLKYNGTYYQPTQIDGQNAYEVVEVQ